MEFYSTGAGAWSSVFAVPADVVDKYIKFAGAAQLKVLLWLLRNSCKRDKITANDIAAALNMNPIDVKDCMEFWVNVGLFNVDRDNVSNNEGQIISEPESIVSEQPTVQYTPAPSSTVTEKVAVIKNNMESYTPPSRTIARVEKPDPITVAQRISVDDGFAILLQETEAILGRPLTHNDSSTLLMLHDNDGLPYEVITMILYFAKSENKTKMKYIETLGRDWGDAGIDTIEKAEDKIAEIMMSKEAWFIVSNAFGLKNAGTPTKKQIDFADLWVNKWGYEEDMIRLAYETCVNSKGEFNMSYINGIIKKWHTDGIMTEHDLAKVRMNNKENTKPSNNTSAKPKADAGSGNTSYDINAFKDFDIFE
ncbi:MAG: DnaD domain protein [Acutalibacteraceae bacterium]|nr:DnaD domain protein [Acutalibacteraceae bacterium]